MRDGTRAAKPLGRNLMEQKSEIFQKNYEEYLAGISQVDLASVKDTLGLEQHGDRFFLPFFGTEYLLSSGGIEDDAGHTPDYSTCVILSKYILRCPEQIHLETEWAAFKDFKRTAQFVNVNYFISDTENVFTSTFAERIDDLARVALEIGGMPCDEYAGYDLAMKFVALPRISLLLLFNDEDEDFPAYGTVLFQKHAEHYLDPESLAMTSAWLARRLAEGLGKGMKG
ncbi:MAG: DUF3786 domain-containing protein [Desulfococcaceae bacterium]